MHIARLKIFSNGVKTSAPLHLNCITGLGTQLRRSSSIRVSPGVSTSRVGAVCAHVVSTQEVTRTIK